MIEGLKSLFVLVAEHCGQLAPLVAFAVVTLATLPHAARGRPRQALAGLTAGAAFVGMYAIFTAINAADIRHLFDGPLQDAAMAAMFMSFGLLEAAAAIALLLGRHGLAPVAANPTEPTPQD